MIQVISSRLIAIVIYAPIAPLAMFVRIATIKAGQNAWI